MTQSRSHPRDWNSSLFSCLEDAGICVWGTCCLPCLFGENASFLYSRRIHPADNRIEPGDWCISCCLYSLCFPLYCCIGGLVRRDLRVKYNLKHEPCGDCFVHMCCFPCAICQEARELEFRGYPWNQDV